MSRRMMAGQIEKKYLAVLRGKFEDTLADTGEIIANIGRCEKALFFVRLSRKDAEIFALTKYKKKILEYEIDGTVYTIVICLSCYRAYSSASCAFLHRASDRRRSNVCAGMHVRKFGDVRI